MLKIPKTIKNRICIFVFVAVLLIVASVCVGGTVANNTAAARASQLKDLLGTLEGVGTKEAPRTFKTPAGHLRFLGSPPSAHFPVDPNKRATPQNAANAFLAKNRKLFVSDSPYVSFDIFKVNTRNSRTYIRYQQMYDGLKVFGAEIVVQVNSTGGIDAVMSDIMRDTKALEPDEFWQNMSIDASSAQYKAIEWMAARHPQLKFDASESELMIFDPPVVGRKGPTRLVWHIDVKNVGELMAQEFILLDANDGTVAFHYSRISYALNSEVYDYENGAANPINPSPQSSEIVDVNRAYAYLGDTWHFFNDNHDHDGYNGDGDEAEIAEVRHGSATATGWYVNRMKIQTGFVTDDLVGHEYAHGVNEAKGGLLYTHNEAGVINEMFADIWGEFIDQSNTDLHPDTTDEYKFEGATDDFSIALWVKRGAVNTLEYILDKRDDSEDGWCLYFKADNKVGFSLDTIHITSSSTITDDDEWHFIVVVIDRSDKGQIFIGDSSHQVPSANGGTQEDIDDEVMDISTDVLTIGRSSFEGGEYIYFEGYIDNVMIFDKALIEENPVYEISDLWSDGDGIELGWGPDNPSECVGYWSMNNNSSIDHIVSDWSGKYNYGNAAQYTSILTADGVNNQPNSALDFNGISDYISIDTTIGDNDSSEVDWKLLEDFSGGNRNMKDPPASSQACPEILYGDNWYPLCVFPDCPPCQEGDSKYCFTHRNNLVGDKLCYLLTDGSGDEPGGEFNGHEVQEMGRPKVSALFYEGLGMLTSQCEYYDLYFALTQAAINNNLSWAERVNIKEGCEAVEICPVANEDDWGLEGHWTLDESEGTEAEDSIGDNVGTLVGDPIWRPAGGEIDGALEFDSDGDYVSLDPIDALEGNNVTVSAWIRAGILSTKQCILGQKNIQGGGYELSVTDDFGNDNPIFYLNNINITAFSPESINVETWYHIAGTNDGHDLKIYVDGVWKGTADSFHENGGEYNAYIGWRFDGLIDDVRVYNYALGIDELWDLIFDETPRFCINNSSGVPVAWFDNLGNLFLKGTLTQEGGQTRPSATGNDEFIFKDSTGNLMIINTTNGNMDIYGSYTEGVWPGPSELEDEFIIEDSSGAVAYIDESGNLYLQGKLYENRDPDE